MVASLRVCVPHEMAERVEMWELPVVHQQEQRERGQRVIHERYIRHRSARKERREEERDRM